MKTGELRHIVEAVVVALNDLAVPYHVTGSLASSFYGEPRLTQDVDFVVRLAPADAARLSTRLGREFLLEPERTLRAAETGGMFQALHRELLIKADFHVGEGVPGELERTRMVELFEGLEVQIVSKEDAILSKLLWVKQGSAKSRRDVLGLLLDPAPIDEPLLQGLADQLGCTELLEKIRSEIQG